MKDITRHVHGLDAIVRALRRELAEAVDSNRRVDEFELDQMLAAASVLAETAAESVSASTVPPPPRRAVLFDLAECIRQRFGGVARDDARAIIRPSRPAR